MKNVIFLDIDGTLTCQDGSVPNSAKEAIQSARKRGHEVILATGRSLPEITEDILEIGLDGIIGAGGGYVEYKGELVRHLKFEAEDIKGVCKYLDSLEVGYYLESNQGLFSNTYCVSKIEEASKNTFKLKEEMFVNKEDPTPYWFLEILKENDKAKIPYDDINKMSFISVDVPFETIHDKYHNDFEVYESTVLEFGDNSGEIGLKGVDKKAAIKLILSKINYDGKTYAYGDGLNDVSMFEIMDYSVAMENAKEGLKNVSNEITDIAENDGIYNSFKRNDLL